MNHNTKAREKEIRKAIKLIGWIGVSERLKTKEDKEIFAKLGEKFSASAKAEEDRELKKAGISF